jgi:hypothetical protein
MLTVHQQTFSLAAESGLMGMRTNNLLEGEGL